MERSSGILLPVSALPSPYGIGSFGRAAFDFIDFLSEAGQRWWQILPLTPVAFGNSPYQSPSAYAGNPYYIDLDSLIEDGLLSKQEVGKISWGKDAAAVDYDILRKHRVPLLEKAADRLLEREKNNVEAFAAENAWLGDYALFTALQKKYDGASWQEWPDESLRMREPSALEAARAELADEIARCEAIQCLFFKQWERVRAYAREKEVRILGDMALYVALDSADVWSEPVAFLLDEKNVPLEVAGVPPDYFSEEGQLWGNPLYNYEEMKKTGYGWWIRRVDGLRRLYDAIRIDHFRGLASFWAVPANEKTAKNGRWVQGPGMDLLGPVMGWFPDIEFIAEDLGILTPDVHELMEQAGLPGMKVLEFAFSANEESSYLPHAYKNTNCVCYAGTHDNDTLLGWKKSAPKADIQKAVSYLGINETEGFVRGILRGGMSSVADLFVAQMQDYLELDSSARMNTPGTVGGNWQWRLKKEQLTKKLAAGIAAMTKLYGR